MSMYDKNFFYEKQLGEKNNTWEILAQPWVEGQRGKLVTSGKCTVPVLKGLIQDTEFSVSGSHNFTQPGGVMGGLYQSISGLVDQVNNLSATASHATKAATSTIGAAVNEVMDNKNAWQDTFKVLDQKLNHHASYQAMKTAANKLTAGGQLVTGFDQIQVFKGTNLSVDLPPISTRIYHDVPIVGITNTEYAYTVVDSLGELMNRFIGPYDTLGDITKKGKNFDNIFGVQYPPNNFKPDFKGIGYDPSNPIQGTFALRYGPHEIGNLLVSSFQFRLSTLCVRTGPQENKGAGYVDKIRVTSAPLYVDVILTIQPATIVSRDMLLSVLNMSQWGSNK